MRTIRGFRKCHFLARVSIFLVIVTVVVGLAGCGNGGGGDGDYYYDLTVASTVGGSVIEPGEGRFINYAANTTVDLVAEADEHYHFANWTGDVVNIGNVTSAATNITMYSDYSITANFELDPGYYSLTISGEGGLVITPGEGNFAYAANTTVDLVAEPDEDYPFLKWAGDVGTVADVQAAATNITMYDSYSITAHFGKQIWDWYDLDAMHDNLGGRYYLTTDIDSTTPGYVELASPTSNDGKGWEPIGEITAINDKQFNGTFDGQGCEIRDLFIHRPDGLQIGFFGAVNDAIIRDIGLVNVNITGYADVGGLAGDCDHGFVIDCYSSGIVTGEYYGIGGLVGSGGVPVSNSYSTASVSGNTSVGGLLGVSSKAVSNCYFSGIVTGYGHVGGLVGFCDIDGSVSNSYSTGSVTASSYVGGLVGYSEGENNVSNCFWDTQTSGQATSDGGTGKTTAEMQDITTFSGVNWDIIAVGNPSARNLSYIWNIIDDETYPFLSWQP